MDRYTSSQLDRKGFQDFRKVRVAYLHEDAGRD